MRIATAALFASGLAALPLSGAEADCSFPLAWPFCIAGAAVNTAATIATAPFYGMSERPYYHRHSYYYRGSRYSAGYHHHTRRYHSAARVAASTTADPAPVAPAPITHAAAPAPTALPATAPPTDTIEPPPLSHPYYRY